MAQTTVAKATPPLRLDSAQTKRATTALVKKLSTDAQNPPPPTADSKTSLLADVDSDETADQLPVWLVLTTKKHIIDKKRLKPGKIVLPHPYLQSTTNDGLRICLITADPQRLYKDLLTHPSFPTPLAASVKRVVGITKLKAKYKSYESRRQLLSEYDVFLADDRVITYLPGVLGKVFYSSGTKRPIPVTLEGKRQSKDAEGNKRRKLADGGTKVTKSPVQASDVSREIQRALNSALVHLAPSTTTAVKVGIASQSPEELQANIETVVTGLVERYVPQQWRNVRSIHIKGPSTAALPIWLSEELWETEADVLEERPAQKDGKKRKRAGVLADEPEFVEVPGPDGKIRRIENPAAAARKAKKVKVGTADGAVGEIEGVPADEVALKAREKEEKAARKASLKELKSAAKAEVGEMDAEASVEVKTKGKKVRVKAADLI